MKATSVNTTQNQDRHFGFFRLNSSKSAVDCAPNTLRNYHKNHGLPLYQMKGDRAVWVRFDEVEALLAKHQKPQAVAA